MRRYRHHLLCPCRVLLSSSSAAKQTSHQLILHGGTPCSAEHNLPDSPFASPTRSAALARDPFAAIDREMAASPGRRNGAGSFAGISSSSGVLAGHLRPSALDIPSPFFPMSMTRYVM
jgi:hypothetical protein